MGILGFGKQLLGCIEDVLDVRDFSFETDMARRIQYKHRAKSLRGLVPECWRQVGGSCTANAIAAAIEIGAASEGGYGGDVPSSAFLYYNGRRLAKPKGVLTDSGLAIRNGLKAMCKQGYPDSNEWVQSKVNLYRKPSAEAYDIAKDTRGVRYCAIQSKGKDRSAAIVTAIDHGRAVVFGTPVSEAFRAQRGPFVESVPHKSAPIAGRHAMCIVGYRPMPGDASKLVFEIRNSWGPAWRDQGHILLSEDYIRWDKSDSFFTLGEVPK